MNYRNFLTLLLAAALIAGCKKQEKSEGFPHRTAEQIFLDPAASRTTPGAMRVVDLAEDRVTPRRETVSLPDGRQKVTSFDDNAKAVSVVEYATGGKRIEKEMTLLADGRRQSHSSYREDGSRVESGELLLDGRYQLSIYDGKGERVTLSRWFNKKGEAERELAYDPAGHAVTDTKITYSQYFGVQRDTLHLGIDGTPLYRKVGAEKETSHTVEYFHAGTQKVKMRVVFWSSSWGYSWTVTEFNLMGESLYEWRISPEKMDVRVNSTQRDNGYELCYRRSDASPSKEDRVLNFELDAISEFDYTPLSDFGNDKRVCRLVEFGPGQDRPSHIVLRVPFDYSDRKKTTQWLNSEMQVIKEEVVTEVEEGEGEKKEKVETTEFPNGKPLAKPIDLKRAVFPELHFPDGLDIPAIKVRAIESK